MTRIDPFPPMRTRVLFTACLALLAACSRHEPPAAAGAPAATPAPVAAKTAAAPADASSGGIIGRPPAGVSCNRY